MTKTKTDTTVVNKDYFIDNFKTVLIILVVIAHFIAKLPSVHGLPEIRYIIYIFHMPCFVFVSGYLAKRTFLNGSLKAEKVLSLLWMYLLLVIAMFLVKCSFTGKISSFPIFKDTGAPWYLFALAVWYLLLPFLLRFKPFCMIILSLISGILIGYIGIVNERFSVSRIIVFLPFFCLGLYLTEDKLNKILFSKKFQIIGIVSLIAVIIFVAFYFPQLRPYTEILYGRDPYKVFKLSTRHIGAFIRILCFALIITGNQYCYFICHK